MSVERSWSSRREAEEGLDSIRLDQETFTQEFGRSWASLLFRSDMPGYLDPGAKEMLSRARQTARDAALDRCSFIQDGADVTWFTWTGSRIHRTLVAIGMHLGGYRIDDLHGIALAFEKTTQEAVLSCYRAALRAELNADDLARVFANRSNEKYEPYLSEELQCRVFGRDHLDFTGATSMIASSIPAAN